MSKYEMIYFDVSGRAAVPRMLFKLAGVEFDDTRFSKEEWAAEKENSSKYPFHQLPVLRVGDTYIAESMAIIGFLANEFDLHGNNNIDRAYVSMICAGLTSVGGQLMQFLFEQDKEVAAKKRKTFFDEQLPKSLKCLEDVLKRKENGDKFWLGEKLTVADVAFLDMSLILFMLGDTTLYDNYPKLKGLKARLETNPILAECISKRTQSF